MGRHKMYRQSMKESSDAISVENISVIVICDIHNSLGMPLCKFKARQLD